MQKPDGDIVVSDHDGVRTICISRPASRNALLPAMYDKLTEALKGLDADPALRVAVLCGEGEHFCAGNDLGNFVEMATAASEGETPVSVDTAQGRLLHRLVGRQKPLVAAVDGSAIGIGFTMLLHVDIVLATSQATFGAPFGPLGLCPEAGSSLALPALIGRQRTLEMFLLGRRLSADEAVNFGLVSRLLSADELLPAADEVARALARIPTHSIRATRRLVDAPAESMSERIGRELFAFASCLGEKETRQIIEQLSKQMSDAGAQSTRR